MKVSTAWLAQWVAVDESSEALAERLTLAGLEVDSVTPAAPAFSGVVVGEVLDVQPHPDADRLRVCTVSSGRKQHQVVCGAPNVHVGMRAPLATVGGALPGDVKIRKAKLRGVESQGMLCSARELGLGEGADGLMPLDTSLTVGADLREALALDDAILDIELTPNRGDCTGMRGVAREVAALCGLPVTPVDCEPVEPRIEAARAVAVDDAADCPAYFGRVIRGVDASRPTPVWMAERLRRAGLRPKSVLVDITNYVLLELGQPMHAFDDDRLSGGVQVRRGRSGESLTLLNDDTIDLDDGCLLITDATGPVALAGAMGGAGTAVNDKTVNVFLESACFAPSAVAGIGRRFKLVSDALYRYERGVDPALQRDAMERATALVLALCGGQAGPVVGESVAVPMPVITLRDARLTRVIGGDIDPATTEAVLTRLGCVVASGGDGTWQVTVPSHRYDLAIEEDLIEEVARVIGYDHLPGDPNPVETRIGAWPEGRLPAGRVHDALRARGFTEAITYSFVSAHTDAVLSGGAATVAVDNPIADHMAVMRTTLWSGLVEVLRHNAARGQARLRVYEIGLQFHPAGDAEVHQPRVLAGLAAGPVVPEQWGTDHAAIDFYDIKADLQALAGLTGRTLRTTADVHPALHPGRSARVWLGDQAVGWLGVLHPAVVRQLDLPRDAVVFEIGLDALIDGQAPVYQPLTDQPAVRRDLAVVADEAMPAARLVETLREAGVPALQRIDVFDVYRGAGLPDTSKSVALSLIFQDKSRTLTDREVDESLLAAREALATTLGVGFRE